MKVAICMAGNLRSMEQVFDRGSWAPFIEKYSPDMFLHTWDFIGRKVYPHALSMEPAYQIYDYTDRITFSRADMVKRFGFTKVEIEKYYPTFQDRFIHETQHTTIDSMLNHESGPGYDAVEDQRRGMMEEMLRHCYSMWYKRWKCFDMMDVYAQERQINYDVVISCRPDYYYAATLDTVQLDCITVPPISFKHIPDGESIPIGTSDVGAVGPTNLMREYCGLYPRLDYFTKKWQIGRNPFSHSGVLETYIQQLHIPYTISPDNAKFIGISMPEKPNV